MFIKIIVNLIGLLIFLFLFWRKLKEDYAPGHIFSAAFYILLGLGLGALISWKFFPAWWFWLEFLGAGLGLALAIFRLKIKFYETVEALVLGFLPWLGLYFLYDSINNSSIISFAGVFVIIGLMFLFYYLNRGYRSLSWYKSGRIGFTGLVTLGVFFIARALVAIFIPSMLSFVEGRESILSGGLAFLIFLITYNLSRARI